MSKGEQTLSTNLPDNPDGFRIALDTSRERADIVLQRPPCPNSESRRYPDLVDRYVCCT